MADVRRTFYDLCEAHKSSVAKEALERIAVLYAIEEEIREVPPTSGGRYGTRVVDRCWNRTTPAGRMETCSLLLSHRHRPSPNLRRHAFRGLLSIHLFMAYRFAKAPLRPSAPKASAASLPALDTGTSKRKNGLFVAITTAGDNDAGIGKEVHDYTEQVLTGGVDDESHFGMIFTIDDGDDSFDPMQSAYLMVRLQQQTGNSDMFVEMPQHAKAMTPGMLLAQELVAEGVSKPI